MLHFACTGNRAPLSNATHDTLATVQIRTLMSGSVHTSTVWEREHGMLCVL